MNISAQTRRSCYLDFLLSYTVNYNKQIKPGIPQLVVVGGAFEACPFVNLKEEKMENFYQEQEGGGKTTGLGYWLKSKMCILYVPKASAEPNSIPTLTIAITSQCNWFLANKTFKMQPQVIVNMQYVQNAIPIPFCLMQITPVD